jgi:methionine synthase (B12-independent) (EC 2.1.1.14)
LRFAAVGDFALYDHMLDTAACSAHCPRASASMPALSLEQYFALARGNAAQPAMEMTKWFDTNYHYLVPELDSASTLTAALMRCSTACARRKRPGMRPSRCWSGR